MATVTPFPATAKQMHVGLGEAIQRLLKLELRLVNGHSDTHDMEERKMLLDALNLQQLDLGFDCDGDDIPDTVEIFAKSAETSCCRILPADQSRRPSKGGSRRRG
jgi:hypothetical protein